MITIRKPRRGKYRRTREIKLKNKIGQITKWVKIREAMKEAKK